jgi:hypothetical protein
VFVIHSPAGAATTRSSIGEATAAFAFQMPAAMAETDKRGVAFHFPFYLFQFWSQGQIPRLGLAAHADVPKILGSVVPVAVFALPSSKEPTVKTALTVAPLCELIRSCEGEQCRTREPSWSLPGAT